MTYLATILLLCCAVIAVAVGVMLTLTTRRRAVNTWAGVMVFGAGAWALLMTMFMVQTQDTAAEWYAKGYYVTAIVMGFGLYKFASYYPVVTKMSRFEHWFAVAVALCVGLLSIVPGGVVSHADTSGATNEIELNLSWYALYILTFSAFALTAFWRLVVKYRDIRRTRAKKYAHQVFSITYSLAIVVLAGVYFDIYLPLIGNYRDIWMGPPFTLIFTGYLLYVLSTQGIFDVRAAITRSVGHIAVVVVMLVLYSAVVFGLGGLLFGDMNITGAQQLYYLLVTLVLLLSVDPLRRGLDKLTYRLFYHRDYNFNDVLQQFSTVTANEIELNRVINKSMAVLVDALAPAYVSLYVMSSHGKTHHYVRNLKSRHTPRRYKQQLETVKEILADLPHTTRVSDIAQLEMKHIAEESGAKVIVQLIVKGEQVGVLFFGERQNGLPYSEQDMQLLKTTSDELALAIQNGLRFDEIKTFNKRLRKEVNTATRELRQSNQQLHRIDEVKDEFLSIASHQLRTPLTSVKGYISLVLDGDAGKINPQQRHLLNEAFTSSQRMVSLIEDFLNMSRLQTGRFVIDRHPSDAVKMIVDEVNSLRTTAEARSLTLQLRTQGKLPSSMLVDEAKLRQVVMNFVDNAIYYSNPDSTIRVKLFADKDTLTFEVKDTGIGVPAEAQSQLFGKFYRAGNARNRRPDGTGVGLYLAKKVITEHGGDIIFSSKEGKGSTFGFRLPLDEVSAEDQAK